MNFSFLGAVSFNWTLFITIMTYVLFFLIVLGAIGKGMKRGGLRASIRLVILVGFTIVAGLVSMPIAKALMGIDLSSLGVAYGDGIAQNLTEIIKGLLFEVEEIRLAASASPALMALIESLPLMVLSLVVFLLATWIFRGIGYIVYVIIEKCLRSSRIERKAKKQAKEAARARKNGAIITSQNQNVLQVPKRNKWMGALVGLVQGIVLAFILFFPVSSVCGIFNDVMGTAQVSSGVVAEANTEDSANTEMVEGVDVIRPYFDSYNNTFVAKFVSMGGFDDIVFDEITKVEIQGETVKIRHDLMELIDSLTKTEVEEWKSFDLDRVHTVVDKTLDAKLISLLVPELVPHIWETYLQGTELFADIPAGDVLEAEISALLGGYEGKFIESLKTDLDTAFDVVGSVLTSGLVDDLVDKKLPDEKLVEYLQLNNNALTNEIIDGVYKSGVMKVGGVFIGNYLVETINKELELETPVKYFDSSILTEEEKDEFADVIYAVIEFYPTLGDIDNFDISTMPDNQIIETSKLLTALQNNAFKYYNEDGELVDRENTVVLNKDVINGGMFANMYVTIVDHFVAEYIENINYKGANWKEVLLSVKAIAKVQNGEAPELEDVMNVLGLDENIGENAKEIAESLNKIQNVENLTKQETAELLNNISGSVDNIGEEEFNSIVNKVAETVGNENLVDNINYEILATEKETASTLAGLLEGDGLNDNNVDESLNILAESEFLLGKVAENGVTVDNNVTDLEDKINAMDVGEDVKNNLKTIFGITVG